MKPKLWLLTVIAALVAGAAGLPAALVADDPRSAAPAGGAASAPRSEDAADESAPTGVAYLALIHGSFQRAGFPGFAEALAPGPRPARGGRLLRLDYGGVDAVARDAAAHPGGAAPAAIAAAR